MCKVRLSFELWLALGMKIGPSQYHPPLPPKKASYLLYFADVRDWSVVDLNMVAFEIQTLPIRASMLQKPVIKTQLGILNRVFITRLLPILEVLGLQRKYIIICIFLRLIKFDTRDRFQFLEIVGNGVCWMFHHALGETDISPTSNVCVSLHLQKKPADSLGFFLCSAKDNISRKPETPRVRFMWRSTIFKNRILFHSSIWNLQW